MPISVLVPLISAVGPSVVGLIKKLLGTWKLAPGPKRVVHSSLPLLVGLAASIVNCAAGCDPAAASCSSWAVWRECLLAGLAGGAGASYLRDVDKNALGIASGLARIFGKRA